MKNASLLALTASTATLFTACLFSGETNAPERASVQLEIKASASTSASALAKAGGLILGDTAGVHVDLSDARLVVSRIKLESETVKSGCDSSGALKKEGLPGDSTHEAEDENEKEKECEEEHGVALKGPFVIDLLTGASTPDLGTLSVPAGAYDKVKIEMHRGQNDSALGGRTLVAHGTLTLADGSAKPFSLELTFNENLWIKSDSAMALDAGALNTVALKLMAGDWLKGLDIAACLGSADTAAVDITEESAVGKCLDADHRIKANFRASFHAHEKGEHEDEVGNEGGSHKESTARADSSEHSGKAK
jgi:hypothetical protein